MQLSGESRKYLFRLNNTTKNDKLQLLPNKPLLLQKGLLAWTAERLVEKQETMDFFFSELYQAG